MTWIGANNRAYTPAAPGGALGAVQNFQLVNQGGTTNNQGSVTNALMQQTIVWTAASGPVDHYQIIRRVNYGPDVDYATVPATQLYFTDTAATNFFSATNIAQDPTPHGAATGPTTIYDYDVVAVDSLGNRGPKPGQFTMWAYRGGVSGTATGGSTTTVVDSGANWTPDQWVGYHVFVTGVGDSIVLTNTSNTLTMIPGFAFSGSTSGRAYQIGGDYFSGVGDVSFGQAAGSPAFTSTGGSPVAPHTFCLGMTHDASTGNMGLQRPSASPAAFIYGLEVGAFNYAIWNQRPAATGQGNEFAAHSRGPPGDLPGQPRANIDSTAMLNYGPSPVAGTWQSYKAPTSAITYTGPAAGITTFSGSLNGSTLTVSGISGPGIDAGAWITGTGVPTATYVSQTPSSNGNGTYTVAGAGIPVGSTVNFSDGKAYRTNFYKGQYKVVGTTNANLTTYYDDIGFTRN